MIQPRLWGVMLLAVVPAYAQLQAQPVKEPGAAYNLDEYSVRAPAGPDWFELKREPHYVYFGKKIVSPTHAFIATAMSTMLDKTYTRPQEFLEYVSAMLEMQRDRRYTVIEKRVDVDGGIGPLCVRYYTNVQDTGAIYAEGKPLATETVGVSCLHPQRPQLAIDVSYSERGYPSQMSQELRAEGERFVQSLSFAEH